MVSYLLRGKLIHHPTQEELQEAASLVAQDSLENPRAKQPKVETNLHYITGGDFSGRGPEWSKLEAIYACSSTSIGAKIVTDGCRCKRPLRVPWVEDDRWG